MSDYKYSQKHLKENQARAVARDASVSTKASIEAVKFLKGKTTKVAIAYLEKVMKKDIAIPYTRFTDGVGHRTGKGITSGRYPQKLSRELIKLIKSTEANASMKGLGEELKIVHFVAHKASVPMHYGRHARREMKRSHIEIIVEEVEGKKKPKPPAKKKATEKPVEMKPAVLKNIPKEESKIIKKEPELNKRLKKELKVEPKVEEKKIVEKPVGKQKPKPEVKIEVKPEVKKETPKLKPKIDIPKKEIKQELKKIEEKKSKPTKEELKVKPNVKPKVEEKAEAPKEVKKGTAEVKEQK